MKRTKQRLGIYTVLLFLLTAAAVALKTAALLYNFNFKTNYFDDKLLSGISDALLIAGVLLSLSYVAVGRRDSLRASFSSPAFYLPSGVIGVALLFFCGEHLASVFAKISVNMQSDFRLKIFTPEIAIELLAVLLALASIGYFILGSLVMGRRNVIRSAFGITVALFLAIYAAYIYFDTSLPINAPIKILDEIAYVFAAVFFLYETRISLGRDMWGAYLAFGMATAILCAASSLPALILYFVRGAVISISLTDSVLTAGLFVFTSSRILHALALRKDEKTPLAVVAEAVNERRCDNPEPSEPEEADLEPDNYTMTFEETEGK